MSYDNSNHATSSYLPTELLHEFAKLTSLESLPALRLVCKTFTEIVTPQLFSCISIAYKDGKPNQFLEILIALAENTHPVIPHAKSLTVGRLGPSQHQTKHFEDEVENKRFELEHKLEVLGLFEVQSASIKKWRSRLGLSKLRNVTSVTWIVKHYDAYDISSCVILGISQMPSLTDFELRVARRNFRHIQLSSLPPLQVISVIIEYLTSTSEEAIIRELPELIEKSSDRLRRLRIKSDDSISGRADTRSLMPYLFHKVHNLPLLKSLSLEGFQIFLRKEDLDKLHSLETVCVNMNNSSASLRAGMRTIGNLWPLLHIEKFHLQEITIDEPNENFLEYLQSYSGIRTLSITSAMNTTQIESDALAISFYRDTLLNHAKSLKKLVVNPRYEGPWCFGEHCVQALTSLTNLRHLSISIVADSTGYTHITTLEANAHPRYEYDPLHPVCRVLQMATSLPKLELLSISGASIKII